MVYDLLHYILLSTHHSLNDEIQNFEYCLDAQFYPIQYPTLFISLFNEIQTIKANKDKIASSF